MHVFFKIGIFILVCSQLKAQTIPSNPAVTVSYNSTITTYRQVPENTDLNQLTDFEKLTFKTRKEQRHYDQYLSRQNEPVTIIAYGSREGYDGTTPDPIVKLIIDKNGSYGYDQKNSLVLTQPLSDKAAASKAELAGSLNKSNFHKTPAFSDFTTTVLDNLKRNGYTVTATSDNINIKNENTSFSYDGRKNTTETIVYKEGKVLAVFQNFYTRNVQNQLIPALKIEKTYETSDNGILIENVRIEQISNYSRTEI